MNILSKFKTGIGKSSKYLSNNIINVIANKKIDNNTIQEIEDVLISADLGTDVSKKLINELIKKNKDKDINIESLQFILAKEIENILKPYEGSLEIIYKDKPEIIIFAGVNGSGKTTSIGKLAKKISVDKKILIAACDTFRAAAVDQITEWAKKTGIDLYSGKENQDPASVAFEACVKSTQENYDLVLIDTAGRLGNNKNLMEQLLKIQKTTLKIIDENNQKVFLVLDGSVGGNIINQFENFDQLLGVDGLIITKLDGTAKGGAIVSLVSKYKIPIYFIGLGEKIDDLYSFKAKEFSLSLFNLINEH